MPRNYLVSPLRPTRLLHTLSAPLKRFSERIIMTLSMTLSYHVGDCFPSVPSFRLTVQCTGASLVCSGHVSVPPVEGLHPPSVVGSSDPSLCPCAFVPAGLSVRILQEQAHRALRHTAGAGNSRGVARLTASVTGKGAAESVLWRSREVSGQLERAKERNRVWGWWRENRRVKHNFICCLSYGAGTGSVDFHSSLP